MSSVPLIEAFGRIVYGFTRGLTEHYNPEEPEYGRVEKTDPHSADYPLTPLRGLLYGLLRGLLYGLVRGLPCGLP